MPKPGQFVTTSQTTDGGVNMNQVTKQHGKNFVQKYTFVADSPDLLPKNVDAKIAAIKGKKLQLQNLLQAPGI